MSTANHFVDMLPQVPDLRIKRMFGGLGIYGGPLMFGLVADDTLYFKTLESDRNEYETHDSQPFQFPRRDKSGQITTMTISSYWRVPDSVLEDEPLLNRWALRALDAARQAAAKPAKSRKARPSPENINEFSGLGAVSSGLLADIGIRTLGDLKREGAIAPYRELKARYPKRISLNLLWGLYALVNDTDVKEIDEETKSHLKSLLQGA